MEPSNEHNDKDLTMTQRILIRANELIKVEGAWIRDDFFSVKITESESDEDYEETYTEELDINKYCALGAVYRAASECTGHPLVSDQQIQFNKQPWYPAAVPVAERLANQINPDAYLEGPLETVYKYNDDEAESQADVVGIFCSALKEELNGPDTDADTP